MKFHLAPLLLLPFLTLELNAAFRASMAFMTGNPGTLNVFEAGYSGGGFYGRYVMMGYSEMNIEYKNDSDVVSSMPNDVFAGGGGSTFTPTDGFRGQNAGALAGGVDLTLVKMASHEDHYKAFMTHAGIVDGNGVYHPSASEGEWKSLELYDTKVKFQKTVLKSGQRGDSFVVTPLAVGFVFPLHYADLAVPQPTRVDTRPITAQLLNPTVRHGSHDLPAGRIDAGAIYLHKDGKTSNPAHIKLVPTISCYMTDDFMDWTDANGDGVTNARIRGCDQGSSPSFDEFNGFDKKNVDVYIHRYYTTEGTPTPTNPNHPIHPRAQDLDLLSQKDSWSGRKAVFVISVKSITGGNLTSGKIPTGKYEGNVDIVWYVR